MCFWGKGHDLAWCSWLFIVWLKQPLVSSYRFSCGQVAFFHFSVLVSSFPPMLFLAHKLIIHWEPVQVYPFVRIPHLWWYPFRFVIFYFHNRYVLLPHPWLSSSMCYKLGTIISSLILCMANKLHVVGVVKSQVCHFLAVWLWASYITSLCLCSHHLPKEDPRALLRRLLVRIT